MLYQYKGGKFKINDITVISNGDLLEITEDGKVTNKTTNSFIDYNSEIANSLISKSEEIKGIDNIDDDIDPVNHPPHYTWLEDIVGIEVIDLARHFDFDLGNVLKYVIRAGHKSENGYSDKEKMIEDLEKAAFYINDKINMLKHELS